jgi:anti-repressor protein
MNSLQLFENGQFNVRTIVDDDGEIWFVAKDIAIALEYKESSLDSMNKLMAIVPAIWSARKRILVRSENGVEQEREMLCLTEQGVYFFLGRSDKPKALPYQIWIAGEVVPSIRKHGVYLTPQAQEELISNPDFIIRLAQELKAERIKVKALQEQSAKDRPKVIFADAVDASANSILIGNLAKILRQNGVEIGQNRLFTYLRENGYLIRCKGERWNMPTQESIERGLFEVKKVVINNPDGTTKITHTTKVTGKGQIYFVNLFLANKEI